MKLPATTTLAQIRQLLTELDRHDVDVIDASQLTTLDTSAVALLLEAHRRARKRGARFEVHGAPQRLLDLAALYGAEDLLSTEGT